MRLLALLGGGVGLGFVCIGAASVANWRRHRDASAGYLAVALGSLGILGLLEFVRAMSPGTTFALGVSALTQLIFMVSGYALFRCRGSLLPMSPALVRRTSVAAGGSALAMAGLTIAPTVTPLPGLLAVASIASLAYVATWCFCVGEPIFRFWRVAQHRTAVQRARLRALALGYAGIVVVLMLSVVSSFASGARAGAPLGHGTTLALDVVCLLALPMLYVSLVPPSWLRRAWRRTEEVQMRAAYRDLVMFSPDKQTLAATALRWAIRVLGAEAGMIADVSGDILAVTGMSAARAEEILWGPTVPGAKPSGAAAVATHRTSLSLHGGEGTLVILAGPFTPLLGREEMGTLAEYASTLALALDRVQVVESLATQTRENQALLSAISDMGEGVVVVEGTRFVSANGAYLRMVGYTAAELRAMESMVDIVVPGSRPEIVGRGEKQARGVETPSHLDSGLIRKDGTILDVEIGMTDLAGSSPARTLAIVRDIRDRKQTEQQLLLLGRTDSLTGVANRHAWDDALVGALGRARRDGAPLCLAMLDVDQFKAFNDDWGHQRGDQLLTDMVKAWKRALREVDTLVRYGGDEFGLLLPNCEIDAALEVLHRVCEVVPERQRVSAGVAQWDGSEAATQLVARADAALYQAKRGHLLVSVALGNDVANQPLSWATQLVSLVQEGALESVYQPIVTLDARTVIGYEALARPTGASADLSVEELFAAAQRLGFSRDLDWLGRRAAVQGAHHIQDHLLFINVGLWSLLDPLHEVDQMLLLLRWAGRDPGSVVFEMSEREVVSDVGRLREVLAAYREAGFRFALDDVGEGHSTFEVLAAADAEFIKVARSLTARAGESGAGSAIRALATFAGSTGAQVIAEGIEDEAMARQLAEMGVGLGQGFGLGRPRRLEQLPPAAEQSAIGM